jgi:hypothetical protein
VVVPTSFRVRRPVDVLRYPRYANIQSVINPNFVFLGAAFSLFGGLSYARDTIRGVTRPNRVSWLLWTIAPLLAFGAEVHQGVGLQSVMTFMVGFAPLIVFCSSFFNSTSVWALGPFDYACGIASAMGILVWILSSNDIIALLAFMAADCLAGLPTIYKSWRQPESESVGVYLAALLNAIITLATVKIWSTAEVAFPIQIGLMTGLEVVLISGRLGPRLRRERQNFSGGHKIESTPQPGQSPSAH